MNRLGIRGVSKGSEFALIAAARYPWIRAVAGCVPTSLVWGAFETAIAGGEPLPNIPYGDYAPVEQGKIAHKPVRMR